MSNKLLFKRFLAWIIDTSMATIPLIIMLPFIYSLYQQTTGPGPVVAKALLVLGLIPPLMFYLTVNFWQILKNKQTLGRRKANISLVNKSGGDTNLRHALLYISALTLIFIAVFYSGIIFLLIIPFLTIPFTRDRRNLFNIVSGTKFVEKEVKLDTLKESKTENTVNSFFVKIRKII